MNDAEREIVADIFRQKPYVQAALVFGSLAGDAARFDSDLDVAVLPIAPITAEQKMDLISALAARFGRAVDVVDLRVEHGPIAREALTKGELVFCRDRLSYAERLRRMLYDEADFVPILRSADRLAIRKWLKTSSGPRSAA